VKLKQNDQVTAVIKSTEVMLMKGGGQAMFSARTVLRVRSNRYKKAKLWVW